MHPNRTTTRPNQDTTTTTTTTPTTTTRTTAMTGANTTNIKRRISKIATNRWKKHRRRNTTHRNRIGAMPDTGSGGNEVQVRRSVQRQATQITNHNKDEPRPHQTSTTPTKNKCTNTNAIFERHTNPTEHKTGHPLRCPMCRAICWRDEEPTFTNDSCTRTQQT